MNSKIQDLIEEAGLESVADIIDCEAGQEGLGLQILEAFAKSIAQRCADLSKIVAAEDNSEYSIAFNDGVGMYAAIIEGTFEL